MGAEMKPTRRVGHIAFTYELMEESTAKGFVRQGLAIVERTGRPEMPFRARLSCNPDGPWLEGETEHIAVSAASAWGFHHTESTEHRAIIEFCARLGEDFVTKFGVDPAKAYELVWNSIVDVGPEVYEPWPSDSPTLAPFHAKTLEDLDDDSNHDGVLH